MIRTGRFFDFVNEFVKIRNEELDDKALWEFWLHKDFEHSYAEFMDIIKNNNLNMNISKEQMVETIRDSKEILDSFVPISDQ